MKYRTIVIDPPWNLQGGGKCKRGADRHYPLLKTKDIPGVIINSGFFNPNSEGCHLYLWTVNNFLPQGIELISILGFRYITNRVWVKPTYGLGQYFRGQHEICLFASLGNVMLPENKKVSTVLFADKKSHSVKPNSFYEDVERISPGPYLEMFAREKRLGWNCWGPHENLIPQAKFKKLKQKSAE